MTKSYFHIGCTMVWLGFALAAVVAGISCASKEPTAKENLTAAQTTLTLNAADITDRATRIQGHSNSVHVVTSTQPIAAAVEPHLQAISTDAVGIKADAAQEKQVAATTLATVQTQLAATNDANAKLKEQLASADRKSLALMVAAGAFVLALAGGVCYFISIYWGAGVAIVGTGMVVVGETILQHDRMLGAIGLIAVAVGAAALILYELAKNKTAVAGYVSAFDAVTKGVEQWTEDRWQGVVNIVEHLLGKKTVAVDNAVRAAKPVAAPVTVASFANQKAA